VVESPSILNDPVSPAYAGSHGCEAVEECAAGVLRNLGEGGHASAGFAEETRGTTAVKPWGSTKEPRSKPQRRTQTVLVARAGTLPREKMFDRTAVLAYDVYIAC
jgi:hypothetical protein